MYEQLKTPYKWGAVIKHDRELTDSPTIFKKDDAWYMMYTAIDPASENNGYDTYLATSPDLLNWECQGRVLTRGGAGWDCRQRDGGLALLDIEWEGDHRIHSFDGKYWCSYIGGALNGYEPDPLHIGLAYTEDPTQAVEWHRLEAPILRMDDKDARSFEQCTLYKSFIFMDETRTLGYPYIMYYNGKSNGAWLERIGMAVSRDMVHWERYGEGAVIDNTIDLPDNCISGDPQIVKMGDLWVMNYFVAHTSDRGAYDTFACSRDLIHWTKWTGEPTVKPSEPFDNLFAHKPFVLKEDGIVYHFYCACNTDGERFIAVATSKDLRKSV
ncbi:hypothetical protein ACF3MZ_05395 [Paenibacillaceae bacterium WGS1546]|uniref:hypothetical protein n=1 Tax=Cohnella sp. WGS1546 TaxID=3366810 RepID=UPI00372D716B